MTRFLPALMILSAFASCNFGGDRCYEEPDPASFSNVTGKWKYVGFCEGEANIYECFDTTAVSTAPTEYSFSSDGYHYEKTAVDAYSKIYRYKVSTDKRQMYYFQLDPAQDGDTIAQINIARLDEDYMVVIYQPLSGNQKVTSELYHRISH